MKYYKFTVRKENGKSKFVTTKCTAKNLEKLVRGAQKAMKSRAKLYVYIWKVEFMKNCKIETDILLMRNYK